MIVGVEGLSQAGKSKFISMFIEKYPEAIRFRGAGAVNVGIQSRWQDYNYWMHNIIEQLDKLNNSKNIILWDRFLTDAVHSEDKNYASEILRAMKSHSNKAVIYLDVPDSILIKRGTKEGNELEEHYNRYLNVMKSFNFHIIQPGIEKYKEWLDSGQYHSKGCQKYISTLPAETFYITDDHITQAYEFIKKQMK